MQIITSKILPPLAPAILKRYARAIDRKEGQLRIDAKYCPAMDLIATYPVFVNADRVHGTSIATEQQNEEQNDYGDDDDPVSVVVWRFNGQQVFTIEIEPDDYDTTRIDVADVDWRDDGQMLVILSSDNMIRIINTFSGKVVHKFSCISILPSSISPKSSMRSSQQSKRPASQALEATTSRPTTIAYSTQFANPRSVYNQLEQANAENGTELDDLLSLNADIGRLLKSKADLPKELASIDAEVFLPRLACLPPAGFGAEDLFSTRNSIDSIFHSSRTSLKSGTIDLLLAGRSDATVHLRLFDSFEIGDIDLSTAVGLPKGILNMKIRLIATYPFTDKVFVIASGGQHNEADSLHLFDLDLKFVSQSPTTLPVLATKATQLQNILRYLKQIQTQLAREIKSAFELPSRFLRPLNEDLAAQDGEGTSFATVAYHTLVTGQVGGAFKEWLVDILGERGVKRWEKAVNDCLDLVRRLMGEGWGPAIERLGVVTSRLAGLAGSNIQGDGEWQSLGIDKRLVEELQQTIDVMAIYGEDVLREVSHELSNFGSFMKWLKWEVDAAGLEDTSERLEELRENNDQNDILKVLEYIDRGVAESALQSYIGEVKSNKRENDTTLSFYDHFIQERRKGPQQARLPTLGEVLLRMENQCQRLFEQIALTLRQRILVSHVTDIPLEVDQLLLDIKVVAQPEYGAPQIHILGLDSTHGAVSYIVADVRDGASSASSAKPHVESLRPEEKCEIMDGKFVDEATFLLLLKVEEDVRIYSHGMLGPINDGDIWHLRHTFSQGVMESGMKPFRLAINGRKHRRAIAVVDEDGRGYCVFDLDSDEGRAGDAMVTE